MFVNSVGVASKLILVGQTGEFVNTIGVVNNIVNNINSFLECNKSGIFSSVFCSLFSNFNGLVINLCLEHFKVIIFRKIVDNFTRAGLERTWCSNNIKASNGKTSLLGFYKSICTLEKLSYSKLSVKMTHMTTH